MEIKLSNIKKYRVVFLIDNLDNDIYENLGLSVGSDSTDWTDDQYNNVCDMLNLPKPNQDIYIDMPLNIDEEQDEDIDYALDFISNTYDWLIDDLVQTF